MKKLTGLFLIGVLLIFSAIGLVACGEATATQPPATTTTQPTATVPPTPPITTTLAKTITITGTITTISPGVFMLEEDKPYKVSDKVSVSVNGKTGLFMQQGQTRKVVTSDELKIGVHVQVTIDEQIRTSYPPQTSAFEVVILP